MISIAASVGVALGGRPALVRRATAPVALVDGVDAAAAAADAVRPDGIAGLWYELLHDGPFELVYDDQYFDPDFPRRKSGQSSALASPRAAGLASRSLLCRRSSPWGIGVHQARRSRPEEGGFLPGMIRNALRRALVEEPEPEPDEADAASQKTTQNKFSFRCSPARAAACPSAGLCRSAPCRATAWRPPCSRTVRAGQPLEPVVPSQLKKPKYCDANLFGSDSTARAASARRRRQRVLRARGVEEVGERRARRPLAATAREACRREQRGDAIGVPRGRAARASSWPSLGIAAAAAAIGRRALDVDRGRAARTTSHTPSFERRLRVISPSR